MDKKQRRKNARLHANAQILAALQTIGVAYVNMDMRKAARILAAHLRIPPPMGGNWKERFVARLPGAVPFNGQRHVSKATARIAAFYASWEWKQLSYETKRARGRKCECCGACAPAVRIVTDHIKPIRRHWELRLEPSNLQVLCDDCNRGKASRDQTDWRSSEGVERTVDQMAAA